jgi:hypothetical protein
LLTEETQLGEVMKAGASDRLLLSSGILWHVADLPIASG